ncbi:putative membrane protein [Methanococcus maripaludis]|uniref:Putative membrane protein n=1 Tax=Methanococcus maripaludis TaxID=39152 RepID=A0A7J9NJM6_METMI|nr:hypothetical protein [Methanococcus maripaludis]MBA2840877.1 putative membrane protein [Methanococcus maripaludis]
MPELTKDQIELFKNEISKIDSDIRHYKENIEKYIKYNFFTYGALLSIVLVKMDLIFNLAFHNSNVIPFSENGIVGFYSILIAMMIFFAVIVSSFCIWMAISNMIQLNKLLIKQDHLKSNIQEYNLIIDIESDLDSKMDSMGLSGTIFLKIFNRKLHAEVFSLVGTFSVVFSILNTALLLISWLFYNISSLLIPNNQSIIANTMVLCSYSILFFVQIYFLTISVLNLAYFTKWMPDMDHNKKENIKETKKELLMGSIIALLFLVAVYIFMF